MAQKIDFQELKDKIDAIFEGDDGYYNFEDFLIEGCNDNSRVELIEQEGGGEGGAESCYTVIKLDDVFYKITYSYYSHHGFDTDYAQAYIVVPVEQSITAYV